MRARHGARLRRREHAAARPEALPPTDEAVARLEVGRRLLEAVRALPDPYRTAVVLRYLDDVPPRVIATRMDAPVATVHTWLRRGLARLRAGLDERHGGRSAWMGMVAPVAGLPPLTATGTAAAAAGGGLIVKKAVVGGVVAALLLGAGGAALHALRGANDASSSAAEPGELARAPTLAGASAHDSVRSDAPGEATRVDAAARPALRVSVRLVPDRPRIGSEPTAVTVRTRALRMGDDAPFEAAYAGEAFDVDLSAWEGASDARGSGLVVKVDHPLFLPAEAAVDPRADGTMPPVEIRLTAASIVRGVVLDENGRPATAATAALFSDPSLARTAKAVESRRVASDGSFLLRMRGEGEAVVIATDGKHEPAHARVRVVAGSETTLAPLLLRPGAAISGTLTVNGTAIDGLCLQLHLAPPKEDARWLRVGSHDVVWFPDERRMVTTFEPTCTDARGHFHATGLGARTYALVLVNPPFGAPRRHDVFSIPVMNDRRREVRAPAADVAFDVALSTLEIRARGAPELAAAAIARLASGTLVSISSGTARVLVMPDEAMDLRIEGPHIQPVERAIRTAPAGQEAVETVELVAAAPTRVSMRLRVQGDVGADADVSVGLLVDAASPSLERDAPFPRAFPKTRRAPDGTIEVLDAPAGRWRAVFRVGPWISVDGYWQDHEAVVNLEADADPMTLDVPMRVGGRIRLGARAPDGTFRAGEARIEGPDGKPVVTLLAARMGNRGGWGMGTDLSAQGPAVTARVLEPRRYVVHLEIDGYRPERRTVDVREGETSEVIVDLTPE
jgi:hypothetical protein